MILKHLDALAKRGVKIALGKGAKLLIPKSCDPNLRIQITLKRSAIVAELFFAAHPPPVLLDDGSIVGCCAQCGADVALNRYDLPDVPDAGNWAWYECEACEDCRTTEITPQRLWWGQVWALGCAEWQTKFGRVIVRRDKTVEVPASDLPVYALDEMLVLMTYPEKDQLQMHECKARLGGTWDIGGASPWDAEWHAQQRTAAAESVLSSAA